MLERNVSEEIGWLVNSTLMPTDLYSQRRTESSRNMNFLGINLDQSNSREGREDPDVRRQRAQVVAAEEGGVGAAGAGETAEEAEGEGEMPVTEL